MGLLDASLFLHRKTAWGKRQDVGCARPDVAFVLQPLLLGVRVLRAPRERVYKHVNSASLCQRRQQISLQAGQREGEAPWHAEEADGNAHRLVTADDAVGAALRGWWCGNGGGCRKQQAELLYL